MCSGVRACSVQLREVYIRIHIMRYIDVSMCQYNFLMRKFQQNKLSGVVLAISGFIYIFVGGALFRVNTFENNVRL